jgi:WD40 repeat protein
MPCGYGLIITGRPDDISHAGFDRIKIIKQEDVDNMLDIKKYVNIKLPNDKFENEQVGEQVRNAIINGSEGLFIFARLVVDDIMEKKKKNDTRKILATDIKYVPQNLNRLYEKWLRRYLDDDTHRNREEYIKVLSPVIVAREALPLDAWKELLKDNLLRSEVDKSDTMLEENFTRRVLTPMKRLLDVGKEDVKVPHKTMTDFLTNNHDKSKSSYQTPQELQIDVMQGHCSLAKTCDDLYSKFVKENGNKLCALTKNNAQIFAIRHAVYHTLKAQSFGKCDDIDVLQWITDLEHLFHWLYLGVGKDENKFTRLIEDGNAAIDNSRLGQLIMEVVQFGRQSLLLDARLLVGEILGRISSDDVVGVLSIKDVRIRSFIVAVMQFVRKKNNQKWIFYQILNFMWWGLNVAQMTIVWCFILVPCLWVWEQSPYMLGTVIVCVSTIVTCHHLGFPWRRLMGIGLEDYLTIGITTFVHELCLIIWFYKGTIGLVFAGLLLWLGIMISGTASFEISFLIDLPQVERLSWKFNFFMAICIIYEFFCLFNLGDVFIMFSYQVAFSFALVFVAVRLMISISFIHEKWMQIEKKVAGIVNDPTRMRARMLSTELLEKILEEENVKVAIPIGELSGLDQVGGNLETFFEVRNHSILTSCLSNDGLRLASLCRNKTNDLEETITIWNVQTCDVLHTVKYSASSVRGLTFDIDGNLTVIGIIEEGIYTWELRNGIEMTKKFVSKYFHVNNAWLSNSGKIAVFVAFDSPGKPLCIWDVKSNRELRRLNVEINGFLSTLCMRTAISLDEKTIALSSSLNHIQIWDLETGKKKRTLQTYLTLNPLIVLSPFSTLLALCTFYYIHVWNVETGVEICKLINIGNVISICFSPDETKLFLASERGIISFWDILKNQMVQSIWGPSARINELLFLPHNNSKLVSASDDGTIRFWDLTIASVQKLKSHNGEILGISFSSNAKNVVSASDDKTLRIWDTYNGEQECVLRGLLLEAAWCSVGISPNSEMVAFRCDDDGIIVQHVYKEWLRRSFIHKDVDRLAFSPNGRFIIFSRTNKRGLCVWDYYEQKIINCLENIYDVTGLCFSPNGKLVVAGADSNTMNVYDIDKGTLIKILEVPCTIFCLRFSNDGNFIVAYDHQGVIGYWDSKTFIPRDINQYVQDYPINNLPVVIVDGYAQFSPSFLGDEKKKYVGFVIPPDSKDWIYSQESPKSPIIICGRCGGQVCLWKIDV